jgi:parallel beta-helix repeat protein
MKKGIFATFMVALMLVTICSAGFSANAVSISEELTYNDLLSIPLTNGKTLYVGGSGPNNYTKIQDAVDDAVDGDTIFVYDDSSPYYENVAINKALFLCGENRQSTKIIGKVSLYSQNDVLITKFTINIITLERSSNITIINNDIKNEENGIKIVDCSNFKIINNNLTEQHWYGIEIITSHSKGIITGNTIISKYWSSPDYACIRMRSVNDMTISNNTFISLRERLYNGIRLEISEDNTIKNNNFIDTGLELWYSSSENNIYENTVNGKPLIYLNGVTDTTIDDAGQVFLVHCKKVTVCNLSITKVPCGITLYDTNQCTISNNTISMCYTGVDCYNVYKNTFSQNTLKGCSFYMDKGFKNIITRNTLQNTRPGIYLRLSFSNTLNNNIISSCNGISIISSANNIIIKNQIMACSIGIEFDESFFNIVKQNNFINKNNAFFVDTYLTSWDSNYWNDWSGFGPYKIKGIKHIIIGYDEWGGPIWKKREVYDYDYTPAEEPYNISNVREINLYENICSSYQSSNFLFFRLFEQFSILQKFIYLIK